MSAPPSRSFDPARIVGNTSGWIDDLTGNGRAGLPPAISSAGEGGKFAPDGAVLGFPGNTFLCHVDPKSRAFAALNELQSRLVALPHAQHFVTLPAASFHMTVFNGISGAPLNTDGWPDDVPQGTDLAEITALWTKRLTTLAGPSQLRMRANHLNHGFNLHLEPQDAETHEALWQIRDTLREVTGLWRWNHDTYRFHITLAYPLSFMSAADAAEHLSAAAGIFNDLHADLAEITFGPIEFCRFSDMTHFDQILYMNGQCK